MSNVITTSAGSTITVLDEHVGGPSLENINSEIVYIELDTDVGTAVAALTMDQAYELTAAVQAVINGYHRLPRP